MLTRRHLPLGFLACLLALATSAGAQSAPTCIVSGIVADQGRPLPGVALTVKSDMDAAPVVSATGADGTFELRLQSRGRTTLTADLFGFARLTRDLTLAPDACPMRLALAMTLASRAPRAEAQAAPSSTAPSSGVVTAPAPASDAATAPPLAAVPPPAADATAHGPRRRETTASASQASRGGADPGVTSAGRGAPARRAAGTTPFQRVPLFSDPDAPSRADDGDGDAGAEALLPPGFSADASTTTASTLANAQVSTAFGSGGLDAFAQRFGFPLPDEGGADRPPGGAGAGFGTGAGGGFGRLGGGPGGGGPGFGRGRASQVRGSVFDTIDSSALDTAPHTLPGETATKPSYLQQRFGATLGGPVSIPHVSDRSHNFLFLNVTGNEARSPYSTYATVPTADARQGDLSAFGRTIVDPSTGQPFSGAVIPAALLNPAALSLLNLIPLPNEPGLSRNLHTVATTTAQVADVNARLVHTFGQATRRPGGGGPRGGAGGGRGANSGSNLNFQVHYRHSDSSTANPFPALNGTSTLTAWDVPVSYAFTTGSLQHTVRADLNRQQTDTRNAFSGAVDVAGAAGLAGVSSDPFDWGAPGLAFSSLTSVRQGAPSARTNQTIALGDTLLRTAGTHTIRVGGDYRDIRAQSRSDANANGSFVFTGLYTGSDLADFLLGLPQQATVQFGPGLERFRSRSADLFVQDDWRAGQRLTLNLGLRYEYYAPVSEAANRLASLDAAAGFTNAVPVVAGGTGAFSGRIPVSIVHPFRGGVAPRVGSAWRVTDATILRAGYGITINAASYQTIAAQLAAQPPFATTATVLASASSPVALQDALLSATSGSTNTYGVDPNYHLPVVQIVNADLQHNITRTLTVDAGYTGTRGSHLDLVTAPDRTPDGTLRIPGVAPFLWDTSSGHSVMHAMTLSLRKRQSHGVAAAVSYTLSRSMDDASSIGGGASVVAQNPDDPGAEWGLSSFDQRHRLSANASYDLPFGANGRWFTHGRPASWFGHWQVATSTQVASGTPFTAQVLGSIRDVATGVNGTLRANYNGAPIALAQPVTSEYFNTSAFSVPAPGTYGSAGRNTIIGPGSSSMNLSLLRSVELGGSRALSIQLMATNVLNTVQFASIDTVVNSPTFGQVTAFRPMRTVQLVLRVRF